MKERFLALRRNAWRERFLAIALESEAAGTGRRQSLDAPRPVRRPASTPRNLRGIRLGCPRAA